jgi:hypothetical protein
MTLFDVEELTRYWSDYPPVHVMLAANFGFGRFRQGRGRSGSKPTGGRQRRADDGEWLAAELGPGFASGDVHAGLDPVVLDFSELRRRAVAK